MKNENFQFFIIELKIIFQWTWETWDEKWKWRLLPSEIQEQQNFVWQITFRVDGWESNWKEKEDGRDENFDRHSEEIWESVKENGNSSDKWIGV